MDSLPQVHLKDFEVEVRSSVELSLNLAGWKMGTNSDRLRFPCESQC